MQSAENITHSLWLVLTVITYNAKNVTEKQTQPKPGEEKSSLWLLHITTDTLSQ